MVVIDRAVHPQKRGHTLAQCVIKEFATQWGLTKHNATHTGNYKLTCDLCGKGFMEQRMMKTHMDGHRKKMIQNHLL